MHKILVADDSLTIQKVIKITLNSEPYEIYECLSSDELNDQVKQNNPDIVLLDFNLCETKTGYELAEDILNISPNAKILMLFGTFDTIDETKLSESGVQFKIVKPFDGTKFINLCQAMASTSTNEVESKTEDEPVPEIIADDIDEDGWVMDSPSSDLEENFVEEVEEEVDFDDDKTLKIELDSLQASVEDWGMDVPGVIGQDSDENFEIPGIIGENKEVQAKEDTVLPSDDDLAFPDESDLEFPDVITETQEPDSAGPQLVSLDSFKIEDETEIEEDEVIESENNIEDLVAAIEDEIDEDNLWSADEEVLVDKVSEPITEDSFVPLAEEDLPQVEPHNLSEVKAADEVNNIIDTENNDSFADLDYGFDAPEDFPADVMDEAKEPVAVSSPTSPAINEDELRDMLTQKLEPMVESLVREYCQKNIEKIAWEVIPDLAENLIKKEIEKITNSILES